MRVDREELVYLLPIVGIVLGLAHQHVAGRAALGTRLVMSEIRSPSAAGVPALMAPVVLLGTWLTHLVGGSVGREGTALAMSGSVADASARRFGLDGRSRQAVVTASLAAGFGSVFGVPLAGIVFAFEARASGLVPQPWRPPLSPRWRVTPWPGHSESITPPARASGSTGRSAPWAGSWSADWRSEEPR